MAPSCLINTYEDVHASIEGLTTSKVKRKILPPDPQISPLSTVELDATDKKLILAFGMSSLGLFI